MRFAVTGATGLVGENLVLEILKAHLDRLDDLSILCLGRARAGVPLGERLRQGLRANGWHYLGVAADDPILDAAHRVLEPVEYDLKRDDLGLPAELRRKLASRDIDHFFHLAALTDFRHEPRVAERLAEVNERGTERVLALTRGLSIGSFAFVSSAYSCGLTYGDIAPDTIDFTRPFQNPYQRSKLVAERSVREFFAGQQTRLRVFRPSTVSGRRIEEPIGYVNKYDVYLGWMAFFLRCKRDTMPAASWEEVVAQPVDIPVRIRSNNEVGLNIVPADFTAKVMLAAVLAGDAESYHVVCERDLNNAVMISTLLGRANVTGWSFAVDEVEPANEYERAYYATVGALYTPYLTGPAAQRFDTTTMLDLCRAHRIPLVGVDTKEALDLMLDFALRTRFGLAGS